MVRWLKGILKESWDPDSKLSDLWPAFASMDPELTELLDRADKAIAESRVLLRVADQRLAAAYRRILDGEIWLPTADAPTIKRLNIKAASVMELPAI